MSRHRINVIVPVVIEIEDDSDVITRCTENHDNWRGTYYDLSDEDEVIRHLAFNCAINGARDGTRLDGWADLSEDVLRMWVDRNGVDFW